MSAWWAWVGHDARRRWRGALMLAVLLAIGGGVVLSAFVGARRNATVVTRLQERTRPMTAMALPNEPGFDWQPVRELPYVRSMQLFAVSGFDVAGWPGANADFPRASLPSGEPMELEVVDAGRLPDPLSTDEVAISAAFHRRTGLGVGDGLTLEVPGPGVLQAVIRGDAVPDVPSTAVPVTIVGIAQGSFWRGDVQTSYGFWKAHQDALTPPGTGYVNAMLLLDGGPAAMPRVEADLERLAGHPIEVIDWTRQLAQITTATKVESSALLAFALVATLVTFVLGGIAIVRSAAASGSELDTLRAIGFTRRQATTAAAARPAAAVVLGIAGAAVVAWLLSGRYPIGIGRQGEPEPGRHANVAILAAGVAVLVLVGIATALLAAWRIGRPRPLATAALRSRLAGTGAADVPLPVTMGARLALERRPGVGGRAATAALTFGVTAVAAALTFGAGLDRGSQDGRLSGQPFDTYSVRVGAADVPTDAVAAWRDDRRVVSATRVVDAVTPIDGRAVAVFALTDLKGRFDDHPLRGRIPAGPDEISFAPTEMRRLGLDIGDTVEIGGRTMHVVGEVFTPEAGHTSYDEGARVVPATLDALVAAGDPVKFDSIVIDAAPDVPVEQYAELWQGIEGDVGGRIEAQANLSPTRLLPRLLAGFVIILTIGATGYAIASTARRRRREVAVLQVLGLTRRQARATVGWHAACATLVAVAIGVPLGFAIGRTLWQALAEDLPIRYVRPDVTIALLAVGAGVVIAAALLTLRPARTTARDEPATLLRAE
jgi:ABC-type lipoprotein release transport system permease subunit